MRFSFRPLAATLMALALLLRGRDMPVDGRDDPHQFHGVIAHMSALGILRHLVQPDVLQR